MKSVIIATVGRLAADEMRDTSKNCPDPAEKTDPAAIEISFMTDGSTGKKDSKKRIQKKGS